MERYLKGLWFVRQGAFATKQNFTAAIWVTMVFGWRKTGKL